MIEYPEEYSYDFRLEELELEAERTLRARRARYATFLSGCALGGMLTVLGMYVSLYVFRDHLENSHAFLFL